MEKAEKDKKLQNIAQQKGSGREVPLAGFVELVRIARESSRI